MNRPDQPPLILITKDLETEKAKAEALFDSIGEPVIATDEYGKIMKVNEAALDLWGYGEEEILEKGYLNVIQAFDTNGGSIEPLSRPVMRALLEGKAVTDHLQYVKKDGTLFPAVTTVSPIMLEGRPIGTIEIIRDITREQEIDRAKTEFVSLASHQLRTPLTAMRWYIELILKGTMGSLTSEQRAGLEEVLASNLNMIELVGALLSVARIEIGTLTIAPALSNIEELARSVVAELKPEITEKRLHLKEEYDPSIPSMLLDPDLTRIIFQNLLTNAVKYTPKGGNVSLKLQHRGHFIHIEIADTGYGVPKRQQQQLFTKLFRADNVRQRDTNGTGLGLYIVKSIVENSKGKIWFESEEDRGTTFYVRLPLRGMTPAVGRI